MFRSRQSSSSFRPAKAARQRVALAVVGLEDRTVPSASRTFGGLEFLTPGTFVATNTPAGTHVGTNGPVQVGVAPADGVDFMPIVEFSGGVSFVDADPSGHFTGSGELIGIVAGQHI